MKTQNLKLHALVGTAILAAIVAVLQVFVSIPLGVFTITLSLVPIIIGAILYGPRAGALLGGVFGVIVLIQVVTGAAGVFSFMMLEFRPFVTSFLCIAKGVAAGLVSGVIFALLKKTRYSKPGVVLAAIACPIVNTGIFVAGLFIFYSHIIAGFAEQGGFASAFAFVFVGVVGLNFVVELAVNVALIPIVLRLMTVITKTKKA